VYMAYDVGRSPFGSAPAYATGSLLHRGSRQLQVTTYQATIAAGHELQSPNACHGVAEGSHYVHN
jgi:hypothetical protein